MNILLALLAVAGSSLSAQAAPSRVGFGAGEARTIQVGLAAPAPDESFQRRLDMIDALERTKDSARLDELIGRDAGLYEYENVLRRAVVYLKDPALVRKLLDAPALDRTSAAYKRAVGGVYGYCAANNEADVEGPIADMLLERFQADRKMVQAQLDFTLSTLSGFYPVTPNMTMTRALVQSGGDLDAALAKTRARIESGTDRDAGAKRYLLQRLEDWVANYRG